MENQLTTKTTGLQKFNGFLTNVKTQNYLAQVLGERKESFVTNCVSLVSNNASLQSCVPSTVMYSAMKATSLGLPLDNNLGFAYVLPYNNTKKNVQEAQFQLGYKGFIQLAMRSGQFKTINVSDVKEGEIESIDRLTGEISFNWIPTEERIGKENIGFVAFFRLTNGFEKSLYMSIVDLQAHGQKYSKSYNSSYSNWKKMFESMASKTVLKLLLSKFAPLSIQMQDAVKSDQAIIREDGLEYVDNTSTIDIQAENEEEETTRILKFIDNAKTSKDLTKVVKTLDENLKLKFASQIEDKENELLIEENK